MTATPAIEIAGLTKSYCDHAVLGGVDLSVPSGTIFALLGSNGADKTTVVKSTLAELRAFTTVMARCTGSSTWIRATVNHNADRNDMALHEP